MSEDNEALRMLGEPTYHTTKAGTKVPIYDGTIATVMRIWQEHLLQIPQELGHLFIPHDAYEPYRQKLDAVLELITQGFFKGRAWAEHCSGEDLVTILNRFCHTDRFTASSTFFARLRATLEQSVGHAQPASAAAAGSAQTDDVAAAPPPGGHRPEPNADHAGDGGGGRGQR